VSRIQAQFFDRSATQTEPTSAGSHRDRDDRGADRSAAEAV